MQAWGNQFNLKNKIRMLADPSAAFTKALDLSIDLPPLGNFTLQIKRFIEVFINLDFF